MIVGRRIALTAVGVLLAAPTLAGTATPRSGLYGLVMAGPIRPVCKVDEPCDAPAQVTLVFSRLDTGREAARTRSTKDGRYRVALPRGYYAVRTVEKIGIRRDISPRRVHVRRGHFDRLVFHIDTGIR